jgi:hypothetical protein
MPIANAIVMDFIITRQSGASRVSDRPVRGIATRPRANVTLRKLAFAAAGSAGPMVVGGAVTRLSGSRKLGGLAGGLAATAVAAVRWQLQRWINDEPAFSLERRAGELELRRYAPMIEARTWVEGADFDRALEAGFRRLAGYIFGGNARREELAMTGPVTAQGERLAMTGPVQARAVGGGHEVAFVMPVGRTLASLPRPTDPRVELLEVPERRIAVLRYRGRYRSERVEREARRLRALVSASGLVAAGEPMFAGFDPPSTVPWLRRNELWLEISNLAP